MERKEKEQSAETGQEILMESCPKPFRILVAEDDREMRTMLCEALEHEGYKVIECNDGWTLIRYMGMLYLPEDREHIDLIVSDIRMPGISGLEILTALHAFKPLPPLVFITAFGDHDTHNLADKLGAIEVFDKPFDIDEFLKRVHWILQMIRRVDCLEKPHQREDCSQDDDILSKHIIDELRKGKENG